MICLGVVGVDEPHCRELSRRMRGATLVTIPEKDLVPSDLRDVSAVAFLGSSLPAPDTIECLIANGTHVLLAADSLHSIEVLDDSTKLSETSDAQFVVTNPDRTLPSRRVIFDEIASGKLGVPGLIRIHRWEPIDKAHASGPGLLPAALVRDLDLALWLKGQVPNVVFAMGRSGNNGRGDHIQVHLGFAGGGMALIDYTNTLPAGEGYQSLSVIGSNGAAYADDHPNRQLLFGGDGPKSEATDEGVLPISILLQSFVDHIATGDESPMAPSWWRQVHELAVAVRQSVQSGNAVSMEGH